MTRPPAKRDPREAREARRARRAAVTDPDDVMEAAATFLAVRARSVDETRRRLLHLGYRDAVVDPVIERLVRLGYLDDAAFARAWIESRDRARPRGRSALRQELLRKGVDDAVVRAALDARRVAVVPGADGPEGVDADPGTGSADRAAAERLLARRWPSLARESDARRRRQRAYALLARNGFDPGICLEVSRSVDAADAADEPEPGP